MYAWLFIVMIVCAVLQTRKGYVDTNRFGQTEHIPVGYFLLISGITGIASTLAIAAMRSIAEIQLVPIDGVFWGANLATGVVFGVVIFAAVFGALCLAFFEAKRHRAKIEAKLDSAENLYRKGRQSVIERGNEHLDKIKNCANTKSPPIWEDSLASILSSAWLC